MTQLQIAHVIKTGGLKRGVNASLSPGLDCGQRRFAAEASQ